MMKTVRERRGEYVRSGFHLVDEEEKVHRGRRGGQRREKDHLAVKKEEEKETENNDDDGYEKICLIITDRKALRKMIEMNHITVCRLYAKKL